jgi:hypothetical protein
VYGSGQGKNKECETLYAVALFIMTDGDRRSPS